MLLLLLLLLMMILVYCTSFLQSDVRVKMRIFSLRTTNQVYLQLKLWGEKEIPICEKECVENRERESLCACVQVRERERVTKEKKREKIKLLCLNSSEGV